jgi:hypothetical protein
MNPRLALTFLALGLLLLALGGWLVQALRWPTRLVSDTLVADTF